ncbi:hypothetical protein BU24DRAFT_57573 [Aaosphaeria arxii CBS 175.79]|uniref:Uncharacterized protein n=1 Tax=Aaosphaeria arxii CBS 175.79 TaxID=1450172 RepID=A0A6A5XC55_9PLEO|nr:uncharacterized protein BU24DRAFT_57573 [Aaosphaeria arxii CBS 175.79]KAF2010387.1 hypothetical protein BU24DRAFT_57573 [Aaosphaeria arxii CBS 175.79]
MSGRHQVVISGHADIAKHCQYYLAVHRSSSSRVQSSQVVGLSLITGIRVVWYCVCLWYDGCSLQCNHISLNIEVIIYSMYVHSMCISMLSIYRNQNHQVTCRYLSMHPSIHPSSSSAECYRDHKHASCDSTLHLLLLPLLPPSLPFFIPSSPHHHPSIPLTNLHPHRHTLVVFS